MDRDEKSTFTAISIRAGCAADGCTQWGKAATQTDQSSEATCPRAAAAGQNRTDDDIAQRPDSDTVQNGCLGERRQSSYGVVGLDDAHVDGHGAQI